MQELMESGFAKQHHRRLLPTGRGGLGNANANHLTSGDDTPMNKPNEAPTKRETGKHPGLS
jgi:hypothetical protein